MALLISQIQLVGQTAPLSLPSNPVFNGALRAMAPLSDGKLLVGGDFTTVNGVSRANLARLNADGSVDATWTATGNGVVRALLVVGDSVYIGGDFSTIGGQARNRVAKVSLATGALDQDWDANADLGVVLALATDGTSLYIGGSFGSIWGATAYARLVRVSLENGDLDQEWIPNPNLPVNSLAVEGSQLYVGGPFVTISGVNRNRLARYNLTNGSLDSWNPNVSTVSSTVMALLVHQGYLYAGGSFTTVSAQTRNRLARFDLATGSLDAWNPNVDSTVNNLAANSTHLYVGGAFANVSLTARNRVARFALSSGALDADWNPNAQNNLAALAVTATRVFLGGSFTSMGPGPYPRQRFAAYPPTGDANGNIAPQYLTPPAQAYYVTSGSSATITVAATGSEALSWQWYRGLSEDTSQPIVTAPGSYHTPLLTADASYWVRISNSLGQLDSETITVSIGTPPAISIQPAPQTVIAGNPAQLSVTASGSAVLSYQWLKNGVDVAGATSATLPFTPVLPSDESPYSVRVTNPWGGVTSNEVYLDVLVDQPPVITAQPQNKLVLAGGSATFSVVVTGSPTLTYQWFKGTAALSGATTSGLTIPNVQPANEGNYHVVITNTYGTATSEVVSLGIGTPPVITEQPQDRIILTGSATTLWVTATGTAPLTYQWYRRVGATDQPVGQNSSIFGTGSLTKNTQFHVVVTNAFRSEESLTATVFVGDPPTITAHPVSQTVAIGDDVTFTGAATGATSYQWYKNSVLITGATNPSLQLADVTASAAGSYTLVALNMFGDEATNTAVLTVLSPPTITQHPVSKAALVGGSATFSVTASGTGPFEYQWRRNLGDLPGKTSATLTLSNIQPEDAGDYSVVVINNYGNAPSNAAVLTVNAPPAITTQPQGGNVVTGGSRTLNVTASGTAPLTYTWFRGASGDTSQATGGSTASFITPALTASTSYWVRVANAFGSVESSAAIFNVGDPPTIATAPTPQTVLAGFTAQFSVTAGGTPPFTYQWKRNGAPVEGGTGSTLSIAEAQPSSEGTYTVVVTSDFGTVTSTGVTLTVNAPPVITQQPQPLILNVGANATFAVMATGSAPLQYQWQKNGDDLPGKTAATLQIAGIGPNDEASYSVKVTNAYGFAISNGATLQVNSPPLITGMFGTLVVATGTSTTLSATVIGSAPFTFQWYRGESGDTSQPVGTNNSNYTTPALAASTAYWLRVSNAFGSADSATSFITVGPAPVITQQPISKAVLGGAGLTFQVTATSDSALTYRWFKGATSLTDGGRISGATTPTLSIVNAVAEDADVYSAQVVNPFATVSSNNVTLTVNFPPTIAQPPLPQTVAAGVTATFSVTAIGTGPLQFQWQKNNENLANATGANLIIPNAQLAHEGAYRVIVTNAFGDATSSAVALTVNTGALLAQQPANATIFSGGTATLTVAATGSGPLLYQWYEGAAGVTTAPVGIDSSVFVTPVLQATRQYWVRVSNAFGAVQSQTIMVTVIPAIPVITSSLTASGQVGQLFRYRITATHSPASFTAASLPAGLMLDPVTGWISGLPAEGGESDVLLGAANATHSGSATLHLTLTAAVPVITSPGIAHGRAGQPFSYQITGTNGPFTSAATGLPGGLSVNPQTGIISGSPAEAGVYSVQLRATNSGGVGLAPLTLSIEPGTAPPVITSAGFASGKVSVAFVFQVQASPSASGFAAAGLPAGLSMNPSSGFITGTPQAAGDFIVTLTASNAGGEGPIQTWQLRINPPNGVPSVTSAETISGHRGSAFQFQITATNSATLFTAGPVLPPGLTLNTATGMISGTPNQTGVYEIAVTAVNLLGASLPRPLVIVIQPSLLSPVLSNSPTASGSVGAPLVLDLIATPAATQFNAANLPTGLSLNPATGRISGMPTEPGVWTVVAMGENAAGPGLELLITMTIRPDADAPVLPTSVVIQGTVGTPLASNVLGAIGASSYESSPLPAGLSLAPESGLIAGTPLVAGEFTAMVTAANIAGRGVPATIRFLINGPLGTPEIVSPLNANATVGKSFSYYVSTVPLATSFLAEPLPPGLVLAGGDLNGTPTVPGDYNVTLSAANGVGQSFPRVLRLSVRASAALPRITSGPYTRGTVGEFFSYQVTAINGPILAYHAESLPAGLQFDSGTGMLSGTPVRPGYFRITLTAANASGSGPPMYLGLGVLPHPLAPVVYSPEAAAGYNDQELSYQIEATGLPAERPLPSSARFGAEGLPPGLQLNAATGLIRGTPSEAGTFYAEVWAENTNGPGARVEVMFEIYYYLENFKVLRPGYISGKSGEALTFPLITSKPAKDYDFYCSEPAYFQRTWSFQGNAITIKPIRAGRTLAKFYAYSAAKPSVTDWIYIVVDILPKGTEPVVTSPTVAYASAGDPFSYAITATGNPSSFEVRNELPAGLSFNATTGLISGTVETPGTYTLVLAAANASGSGAPRELTLTIRPADGAPAITGGSTTQSMALMSDANPGKNAAVAASGGSGLSAGGQVGVPFGYTLTASGGPTYFVLTGLPEGLAFNETTGEIAGVPASAGRFEVEVAAVNEAGTGASAVLTLTIAPATGTPAITSPMAATGQVGVSLTHTLTANPGALGFTATGLPEGLVLDSAAGVISGVPTEPGIFRVLVAGLNGIGKGASSELTLTITPAPGTPMMANATATGSVGSEFQFELNATNNPEIFSISDLPIGLMLDAATGLISGQPQNAGLLTVEVWAENAVGRGSPALLTFEISPAAASPALTNASLVEVAAGLPFAFQLSASPAATSFNHSALPEGLTFNAITGLLSGAVAEPGDYPIELSANNASGTGALQTLTVRSHLQSSFRGWALAQNLPPGSDGVLDAPFGDGIKNLHRFAFGLTNSNGSLAGLPVPTVITHTDGERYLALVFNRTRDLSGVSFQLRGAGSLGGWQNVTASAEVLEVLDDHTERVRFRDSVPLSGEMRRFLQVVVESAP